MLHPALDEVVAEEHQEGAVLEERLRGAHRVRQPPRGLLGDVGRLDPPPLSAPDRRADRRAGFRGDDDPHIPDPHRGDLLEDKMDDRLVGDRDELFCARVGERPEPGSPPAREHQGLEFLHAPSNPREPSRFRAKRPGGDQKHLYVSRGLRSSSCPPQRGLPGSDAQGRVDVVVNCAAFHRVDDCEKRPDEAFRINALGALHVARACAEINAVCVYVSTDYVLTDRRGCPTRKRIAHVPSTPMAPRSSPASTLSRNPAPGGSSPGWRASSGGPARAESPATSSRPFCQKAPPASP